MSPRLARRRATPTPAADLALLRQRIRDRAENRPAVYRMLDAEGRIIYVGKAKRLRTRLMTYFRAAYPDDKAARILYASHDIAWDYSPSEFSAYLGELRQIKQYRPAFNYRGNLTRRSVFIKVSKGPAPRVYAGEVVTRDDVRCYGPFRSLARTGEAVRTLNDLLGLRDCVTTMPILFSGQGDLFGSTRQAACMRHEFGFCTGPCAGFVAERDYRTRLETAVAFLEGRSIQPIDKVVTAMQDASRSDRFELAVALAGEVRASRVAAGGYQPGAHGGGYADVRLSRPRNIRRRPGLSDPAGRRPGVLRRSHHADRDRSVSGRRFGRADEAGSGTGPASAGVGR